MAAVRMIAGFWLPQQMRLGALHRRAVGCESQTCVHGIVIPASAFAPLFVAGPIGRGYSRNRHVDQLPWTEWLGYDPAGPGGTRIRRVLEDLRAEAELVAEEDRELGDLPARV